MAKYKTFYSCISDSEDFNRNAHDKKVNDFLEDLENECHTLIKVNTISYGTSRSYRDCIRTEIIYRENYTRKVITEKTKI